MSDDVLIKLTAAIVSAHVSNNSVSVGDMKALIDHVHAALNTVSTPQDAVESSLTPAVSIRASVKPDYIICLEDGKKLKVLKRHLMTRYSLTPVEYRAKWGLAADYPLVAPNYSKRRSELARNNGLGRKRGRSAID